MFIVHKKRLEMNGQNPTYLYAYCGFNISLTPRFSAVNLLWLDNGGDGWQMTPNAQLWLTPGHTEEDASLVVSAEDGTYAMTHLWWKTDRTPVIDPYAPDQAILDLHRARVLEVADVVIPGHGEAFRVER